MTKKNQNKKHKFKYSEPTSMAQREVAVRSQVKSGARDVVNDTGKGSGTLVVGRDFHYVAADLRRITIMAAILIVLELILWALITYTGFGPALYDLVRV